MMTSAPVGVAGGSNRIICSFLKCAAEISARTKSSDIVRVHHPANEDVAAISKTEPVASTDSHALANDAANSSSSSTNDTPCSHDRTQRRKEKKRKKKELRAQMKERDATLKTHSLRVTTTLFSAETRTTTSATPRYVQVYEQSERSIVHVKPLVVLDLNGILCHRVRQKLPKSSRTTFRPSLGSISNTEVIPRSDLHEFLTLLNDHFSLAVWTSATQKTARLLVRALFPPKVRDRLVFVWSRSLCNLVDNSDLESSNPKAVDDAAADEEETAASKRQRRGENDSSKSKGDDSLHGGQRSSTGTSDTISKNSCQPAPSKRTPSHDEVTAIKCLSKVWEAYPLWDATNTVLIDDSREKCPDEFRGNAIHPPPICGTVTAQEDDDEGNQRTQRQFFQLLAGHWSQPSSPAQGSLMDFLEKHASSHRIGWEKSSLKS